MSKRLKNCISGRIPKVDAVRDLLSRINPDEIRSIHEEMIDIIKRNRVFREGTIGGCVISECSIYQHSEGKWSGRGDTPERRKKNDFSECRASVQTG